jgi:epoxyqueuosine reductase
LTIEHRGDIAVELRAAVGAHVYGCDICQEVCPWNVVAPRADDPAWQPRAVWDYPTTAGLTQMSDAELQGALRGSPMRRARLEGLRRNVAMAEANRRELLSPDR